MPRYDYRCLKCNKDIEALHAISEKILTCSDITSCDQEGVVEKVLSLLNIVKAPEATAPPGQVVKKFIADSKKDLKQHQEELKTTWKKK